MTWNTWKTFRDAYDNLDGTENHPSYGFLIYGQSFIDMDFNPTGVVEAVVAVDGGDEGLTIVASIWDGSQDCWNTVEIHTSDIDFWCRKPLGPK